MNVLATSYLTNCNYQIGYDLISQSVSNYSSTLKVYGVLNVTGNYVSWSSGTARVWNTTNNLSTGYSNGSYVLAQETITIPHSADGTRSIYIGGALTTSYVSSGEIGGTAVLPKIERYPQILNAPNFNDEENPTVTYSTVSGFSDAVYKICISLNGTSDSIAFRDVELSDGEYTFNLTTAERNLLRNATPNSNELDVIFWLRTTSDNINYDSKVTKKMSIVNANPTFTHSEVELNQKIINVLGNSATTVVQNVSELRVTITPTALKGASIASVNVGHGNLSITKTNPPYTFDVPIVQEVTGVLVTDSRNNKYAGIFRKTLIEYTPVKLNAFSFERENPTSSNIIVNIEGDYTQKTFGSTANTPVIKWKLDNGSYLTIPSSAYVIDTTNNKIRLVDYELTNALVYTSSGYFSIQLSDLFTSSEETEILVLKGIPTFDYGEHDLQVNGDLYVADINRENPVNVLEAIEEAKTRIYSTTETAIGEWIDGSTVYRKCFQTTNVGNTFTITHGITNYGVTVNYMISASHPTNNASYVGGERSTSNYPLYMININNTNINCYQSGFNDWNIYVVLEYTKRS